MEKAFQGTLFMFSYVFTVRIILRGDLIAFFRQQGTIESILLHPGKHVRHLKWHLITSC